MRLAVPAALAAAALFLGSCAKEPVPSASDEVGEEIVIGMDGVGLEAGVDTKVTAVTAISGTWYWGATTGSGTSEASKWANASATPASNKINTGKYQTATPTAYNYYVSNNSLTIGANTTVTAENTKDVICGRTAASTSTTPAMTLNHIFARTGTITFTAPSGGTITNASYKLVSKGANTGTKGTYNLRTAAWSGCTALASTTVTGSSDLYLIPGTYTITATFTLTMGEWTGTLTRSADITLVGGKINNITLNTASPVSPITISLTLTAWGTQAVTATVS